MNPPLWAGSFWAGTLVVIIWYNDNNMSPEDNASPKHITRKGEGFILRYTDTDDDVYTGSLGIAENRPTFSKKSARKWAEWINEVCKAEIALKSVGDNVFINDRLPPRIPDQE